MSGTYRPPSRRHRKGNKRTANNETCRGKVRYRDHAEATRVLQNIRTKGDARETMPCRAYECDRCKGWHLTSKP